MADDHLDAPDEPKKKKKGLLIWIILLLFLGGLGAGGYFYVYPKFFAKPKPPAEGAAEAPAEGGQAPAKTEEKAGGHGGGGEKGGEKGKEGAAGKLKPVALAPFVVNLADPLGRRYLKLTIMVETNGAAANAELTDKEPQVRDQIIMLLSSKSYQELATMENKMALKADIVRRLNQIMGGSKVLQVYFTEMVIQ